MSGTEREARLAAAMRAAQDGDGAAYAALLRDCVPLISAIARGQGAPAELVDDVVQDVLLTIHRARQTYDPARPFLPWLRAIAQRRTIDVLRRHLRRRGRELHDPLAYEAYADPARSAGEAAETADRARQAAGAIAALPAGQRQAVERLVLREQSLKEAAAETGRSTGALKVNLHRALKALRARLAGEQGDV